MVINESIFLFFAAKQHFRLPILMDWLFHVTSKHNRLSFVSCTLSTLIFLKAACSILKFCMYSCSRFVRNFTRFIMTEPGKSMSMYWQYAAPEMQSKSVIRRQCTLNEWSINCNGFTVRKSQANQSTLMHGLWTRLVSSHSHYPRSCLYRSSINIDSHFSCPLIANFRFLPFSYLCTAPRSLWSWTADNHSPTTAYRAATSSPSLHS